MKIIHKSHPDYFLIFIFLVIAFNSSAQQQTSSQTYHYKRQTVNGTVTRFLVSPTDSAGTDIGTKISIKKTLHFNSTQGNFKFQYDQVRKKYVIVDDSDSLVAIRKKGSFDFWLKDGTFCKFEKISGRKKWKYTISGETVTECNLKKDGKLSIVEIQWPDPDTRGKELILTMNQVYAVALIQYLEIEPVIYMAIAGTAVLTSLMNSSQNEQNFK